MRTMHSPPLEHGERALAVCSLHIVVGSRLADSYIIICLINEMQLPSVVFLFLDRSRTVQDSNLTLTENLLYLRKKLTKY